MKYIVRIAEREYEVEIRSEDEITIDGQPLRVDFRSIAGQPIYSLILNGRSYEAYIAPDETELEVLVLGHLYHVTVEDERQRRLRQTSGLVTAMGGEYHLRAPMPGLIVAVPVTEGDDIARGQNLVILESMKMQNELRAPRDGMVTRVRVKPNDRVEQNQVLVTLG